MNHRYLEWSKYPSLPQELAQELSLCAENEREIEDRFHCDLAFGTGGLRGILGVGINRMNCYTVAKATRGLAEYLCKHFSSPCCAIAYDSRHKSEEFAQIAAATLAAKGIQVFLFSELMPTPMLSFAVRHLQCSSGVVITASHNPAKYNGYKVYGADGCQITLEIAQEVQAFIAQQPDFAAATPTFHALRERGSIQFIGNDTVDAYFAATRSLCTQLPQASLRIVYSPLNGAGCKPVQRILREIGNVTVILVPQQALPDGNFPTCPYPNPETEEAMRLASALALQTQADFCLATDPDCDRVGVGVPTPNEIRLISGNEMGIMLFEYICKQRTQAGTMPQNPVAVKTIVTTEIATAIAQEYDVELRNVLTGFKFIGEQIGLLEAAGQANRFLFGFEESYGYLAGSFVRDKDAVLGSMLICEMAAYYKTQGKNLLTVLEETYQKYGYYKSQLLSFTFDGASGMQAMNDTIETLRKHCPTQFASKAVCGSIDYQNDVTYLPKSNMLSISLAGGSGLIIRPSGTEPKLKLYVTAVGQTAQEAEELLCELCGFCKKFVGNVRV